MFKQIAKWWKTRRDRHKLANWYKVTWDDEFIFRSVSPPRKEAWQDQFRWADIERICFEATDFMISDNLYFFTCQRPESYEIPTEARGGGDLWNVVLEKELFDVRLAIRAATSTSGLFCWPQLESQGDQCAD